MTTQDYQQASERFLAQARQELAAGDLAQASEKGWGATAQISRPLPNSVAGSTTGTGTTSGSPVGSGPKPATATSADCLDPPACFTKTSTKTR